MTEERPTRKYSMRKRIEKAEQAAKAAKRGHAFKFFRVGQDLCGICGKTLKEHKT